jgi:hypothetical protein
MVGVGLRKKLRDILAKAESGSARNRQSDRHATGTPHGRSVSLVCMPWYMAEAAAMALLLKAVSWVVNCGKVGVNK